MYENFKEMNVFIGNKTIESKRIPILLGDKYREYSELLKLANVFTLRIANEDISVFGLIWTGTEFKLAGIKGDVIGLINCDSNYICDPQLYCTEKCGEHSFTTLAVL